MVNSKFKDRIDLSFKYTCAAKTDISKTIQREKERLKKLQEEETKAGKKVLSVVKKVAQSN